MSRNYNRRRMLKLTGQAVGAGVLGARMSFAAAPGFAGLVAGEPTAAEVGNKVLKQGGNAIDAVVAAALAAAVAAPHSCGIGGYGGHMVLALAGGKKITAIDFNSTAPAAAHAGMFPLDQHGAVRGQANEFGWLSAGVPGTLAGLQLALDRFGTRHFREVAGPAIQLAREGFTVSQALGILKDLNWSALPAGPERTFACLEALRLAWSDRLQLLGDPGKTKVPVPRLLSQEYAHSQATKVESALRERKPLSLQ